MSASSLSQLQAANFNIPSQFQTLLGLIQQKGLYQYDAQRRRQIVNFKQLLKINIMKKEKKDEQAHSINFLKRMKTELNKAPQNEIVKLPYQAKNFREICVDINSTPRIGIGVGADVSKNNNRFIFPSLHLKKQRKSLNSHNQYTPPPKRADFFQKIKEISMEKPNISTSKSLKKKKKDGKVIYSHINLPSKLICRSISPLSNDTISPLKRLSLGEKIELKSKLSIAREKVSSRYEDIPISQFIYDNAAASKQLLSKALELKMEKVWRKKSKNTRSISLQK